MDASVVVNIFLVVITAGAMAAAFRQASEARKSRIAAQEAESGSATARDEAKRLSQEANAAFIRQAEAQEKANALKEAELAPPVWSGPRWIQGQQYAMTNSSGRTIVVEKFDVQPDEAVGFLHLSGKPDNVYEYGDALEYVAMRASGLRPEKITVFWRFQDEPDTPENQFIIPL